MRRRRENGVGTGTRLIAASLLMTVVLGMACVCFAVFGATMWHVGQYIGAGDTWQRISEMQISTASRAKETTTTKAIADKLRNGGKKEERTSGEGGNEILDVFLIPHSHCDPGWLLSFEEYYRKQVRVILDGVLEELEKDPSRRFIWAEVSFFQLWWEEQAPGRRVRFRRLVEAGQVEFVEGGWVQNDEAGPDAQAVVEQLTAGHEWLLRTFGVRPRVGWQIDPFGHSSLTPTVMAQAGLEALVINRIHFRLKAYFKQTRHMEFVWRGSPTLRDRSEIFTHVLHSHYSAPNGFDWEDAGALQASRVPHMADVLAGQLRERAAAYRSNTLMVVAGDDFKYQKAAQQFNSWDMIIDEVNAKPADYGMRIRYATVSEYIDALRAHALDFPLYVGDFFPYADNSDSYWTGYYSTRPMMKWAVRDTQAFVRSADALTAMARAWMPAALDWPLVFADLERARNDAALFQHHDGITGTSRQAVVGDYRSRLDRAKLSAKSAIASVAAAVWDIAPADVQVLSHRDVGEAVEASQLVFSDGKTGYVVGVVNSLGWTRHEIVRVPVEARDPSALVVVEGPLRKPVRFQVDPVLTEALAPEADKYYVYIEAVVPPLGVASFAIGTGMGVQSDVRPFVTKPRVYESHAGASVPGAFSINNTFMMVEFSGSTGLPAAMRDHVGSWIRCEMSYLEFETQRSGAYIFRSDGRGPKPLVPREFRAGVLRGPLVQSVITHHHFSGGERGAQELRTTFRLYESGGDALEVPEQGFFLEVVHDVSVPVNRELIARYDTSLATGAKFFTDNGVEMLERHLDRRPLVDSQHLGRDDTRYYPVVSTAFLRDESDTMQFAVLSKQSMGASSHRSGGVEFMLHRQMSADDGRGLAEAVHDTSRVHTVQWLTWGAAEVVETLRQHLLLRLNLPAEVVCAAAADAPAVATREFAPVAVPLPPNVHLAALRPRDRYSDDVLLRLRHIFGTADEAAALPGDLAGEEVVNVESFFGTGRVGRWRDRTLTFNRPRDHVLALDPPSSALGVLLLPDDLSKLGNVETQQNSDEQGVFISQAALDHDARTHRASPTGRKLSGDSYGPPLPGPVLLLKPLEFRSIIMTLHSPTPSIPTQSPTTIASNRTDVRDLSGFFDRAGKVLNRPRPSSTGFPLIIFACFLIPFCLAVMLCLLGLLVFTITRRSPILPYRQHKRQRQRQD